MRRGSMNSWIARFDSPSPANRGSGSHTRESVSIGRLAQTWALRAASILSLFFQLQVALPHSAMGATPIDLANWTVIQYEMFDQPDANWVRSADNASVTQTVNADASILIGDFDSSNLRITGTWSVQTSDDDDFMGFVFGYQDRGNFYLFDWKQGDQNDCAFGQAGMSLKVVQTSAELRCPDLWPTSGSPNVRVLRHNTIPYSDFTEYQFTLQFNPGLIVVEVRDTSSNQLVQRWDVIDSSFSNGKFGFYNYSQGAVRYTGFTEEVWCSAS